MKPIKLLVFVFVGLLVASCNKSDDGSYTDPITVNEKIQGTWNLMNLKMVDQYAKANGIEPSDQNLSTFFNYDVFQISFDVDGDMKPTSYEVKGNVPPIFQLSGFWSLETDFQPTNAGAIKIFLYSDAQKTNRTDTLLLTSVPGSNEEMEVQLVRTSGGTSFVSYVFNLTINN